MKSKVLILFFLITSVHGNLLSENLTDATGDVIFIRENDQGVFEAVDAIHPIFQSADIVSGSYEFDTETNSLQVRVDFQAKFVAFSDERSRQLSFSASNSFECSLNTCNSNDILFTYDYITENISYSVNGLPVVGNMNVGDTYISFNITLNTAQEVFTRTRKADYRYSFFIDGSFSNESSFSDNMELAVDLSGNVEIDLPFPVAPSLLLLLLIPLLRKKR